MNVERRQSQERMIVKQIVTSALEMGHSVSVNDGEETTVEQSKDKGEILSALFTTDEDYIMVYNESGRNIGTVFLVYGNDGWDVINDYSCNLEELMTAANALAERLSEE